MGRYAILAATSSFAYVQESSDAFLSLFPHRYDYIYAPYPELGTRPHWQTESRHPLSDRLIRQGNSLYGVRFAQETQYCLLDIDKGSVYHPQNHPQAFVRVLEILEDVGLVSPLICTSSSSGGLHVYFPLQVPYASWRLGSGLANLLESRGINVRAGQLEVFPNAKTFATSGKLSLFNAHRLPLQQDSYILNTSLEPIYSSEFAFIQHWQACQHHNTLDTKALERLVKQRQYQRTYISAKADKFLSDLNIEIELGWTDHGQTNRLLGRIAMRAYVFHHVIHNCEPLSGDALVKVIIETATSLPGYHDWCRHQHEIEARAAEWAKCVEVSHYFPYGHQQGRYKAKAQISTNTPEVSKDSWNQQRAKVTQEKIQKAVADLIAKKQFPVAATTRFRALLKYGIGGASLYRYRYLWHPENLLPDESCSVSSPFDLPRQNQDSGLDCALGASNPANPTSLLQPVDGNSLSDGVSSDLELSQTEGLDSNSVEAVRDRIRVALTQARLQQRQPPIDLEKFTQTHRQKAQQRAILKRMTDFVRSEEPILMVEAVRWLQSQPGIGQQLLDTASSASERADLAENIAIAEQFARLQWTAWQIRERLVQCFQKESLGELTPEERDQWISHMQRLQKGED